MDSIEKNDPDTTTGQLIMNLQDKPDNQKAVQDGISKLDSEL